MDFHLPESIRRRIREELPEARRVRRLLHAQPETKFEEVQTAAFLRQACTAAGIALDPPLIGTDVTGRIQGALPGPTILLRADIDALPLEEDAPERPWRSTCPGKAHACGHDGHMAILLGALRVLAASTDILPGTVRFVFQPAEEEIGGGKAMIARGLLDLDPTPDAAFALHGWPGQTAGTVSAAPGPTMAAADSFVVRIRGQGAHGAQPQRSKDPVVAAAQAICTLQTLASRSVDPLQPFVLSVCSLHGGTTRNVIPAEVQFEGTVRCFDPELRSFVRIRMEEILAGICTANGCHHSLEIIEGYSPLVNDPRMVAAARAIVTTALGPEHWSEDHRPSMASEDFAYYLERVPGCMLRLGLGQDSPPLHHPGFDFNDEVLETGISLMVALALGLSGAWDPRARL